MRYFVTNFDAASPAMEYGVEETIVEDDQIGNVTMKVLDLDSLEHLNTIAEDVWKVEVQSTSMSGVEGEIIIFHEEW